MHLDKAVRREYSVLCDTLLPLMAAPSSVAKIETQIDALKTCTSVEELGAKLRPILLAFSYYLTNSEAVISETQEEWHDDTADILVADTVAALKDKPARGRGTAITRGGKGRGGATAARASVKTAAKSAAKPPPRRVAAEPGLTPALAAIMSGSHASFRAADDDD